MRRTLVPAFVVGSVGLACHSKQTPEATPRVASLAPTAGTYGTTLTVRGERLEEATVDLEGLGPVMPTARDATSLSFRFVFPATGAISIVTKHGDVIPAGEFVPTWLGGQGIGMPKPLAVVRRGADALALAVGVLGVFKDAGAIETRPVPSGSALLDAIGEQESDGSALFVARDSDALYTISFAGADAALTRLASITDDLEPLALGLDEGGPVLAARRSDGVYRMHVRPETPGSALEAEPTPLALTIDDATYQGFAFAPGGELLAFSTSPTNPAAVALTRFAPGDFAGSAPTEVLHLAGPIATLDVARVTEGSIVVAACSLSATNAGEQCAAMVTDGTRIASLGTSVSTTNVDAPRLVGSLAGGALVSTVCADGALTAAVSPVDPDAAPPPGDVVLEPCTDPGLPLLGPDGHARVLVSAFGMWFLTRPRP